MDCTARIFVMGLLLATPAFAAVSEVNLANYQHTGTFALPPVEASEASAVVYNPDTDTLFVLGDEGESLVQVSKTGTFINSMTLTGFDDTEGLTYIGGGQFVIVEERLQDLFRITYTPGTTVARNTLSTASLGDTVGNIGIEGATYDPSTGKFIAVKEKTPQRVIEASVNFTLGTATVTDLFTPSLGTLDLSDVQVLSTVPSLAGKPDAANLLIYSQESAKLLEVSRTGSILSEFSFAGIASDAEGVTIDNDGIIYVVGETPELYVLTPVPEPASLLLAGLGTLLLLVRRQR